MTLRRLLYNEICGAFTLSFLHLNDPNSNCTTTADKVANDTIMQRNFSFDLISFLCIKINHTVFSFKDIFSAPVGDVRRKRLIVNYFSANLRKEIKLPNDENDKNKLCQQLVCIKNHSKVGSTKSKKKSNEESDYGRGIMRGLTTRNNNNNNNSSNNSMN